MKPQQAMYDIEFFVCITSVSEVIFTRRLSVFLFICLSVCLFVIN